MDRGLYLGVCSASFVNGSTFNFNEETGEITQNADSDGVNVIFDLPIDESKANHEKAEQFSKEIFEPKEENLAGEREADEQFNAMVEDILANGILDTDSVKPLTYDKDGLAWYKYKGIESAQAVFTFDEMFREGEVDVPKCGFISEDNNGRYAVVFSRDRDGIITGMVYELKTIKNDY